MHIGVSVPARDLAQDRNGGCPRRFVADALDRLAPHRGVWVCASDVDDHRQTGAVLHLPQGLDRLLLHVLVGIFPRDRGEHAHGLATRERRAEALDGFVPDVVSGSVRARAMSVARTRGSVVLLRAFTASWRTAGSWDRVARAISESVDTGARRCALQSPPITPASASPTTATPASQRRTVAPAGGSTRRRTRPTSEPPLAPTARGAARRSCSIVSRAVA